jgi:hypothetical protein
VQALKASLQARYQWRPYPSKDQELFVQLGPGKEGQEESIFNVIARLRERHSPEEEIGEELEQQRLGTWSAGDLGEGGMNMLYEVTSVDTALPVIMRVIQKHQLQGRTRIARRLMTTADDWRYEVIYPIGYSGAFNPL